MLFPFVLYKTRQPGRSGLTVPGRGRGTSGFQGPPDDAESIRARARALGRTFSDPAAMMGSVNGCFQLRIQRLTFNSSSTKSKLLIELLLNVNH